MDSNNSRRQTRWFSDGLFGFCKDSDLKQPLPQSMPSENASP
ncbi:hypothetical protein [Neisseria chenwenguii]|nr:hypothetical protein [Neisseria chenwenguii]